MAEALIIELTHERSLVPPVPILYDLDTAAMLCGMSRRELRDFLRSHPGEFSYRKNRFTHQRFLTGGDIQRIRELTIVEEPVTDYDERAKNLPSVQKRLVDAGFAIGGGDSQGPS